MELPVLLFLLRSNCGAKPSMMGFVAKCMTMGAVKA
jgi:hypothetical protein